MPDLKWIKENEALSELSERLRTTGLGWAATASDGAERLSTWATNASQRFNDSIKGGSILSYLRAIVTLIVITAVLRKTGGIGGKWDRSPHDRVHFGKRIGRESGRFTMKVCGSVFETCGTTLLRKFSFNVVIN